MTGIILEWLSVGGLSVLLIAGLYTRTKRKPSGIIETVDTASTIIELNNSIKILIKNQKYLLPNGIPSLHLPLLNEIIQQIKTGELSNASTTYFRITFLPLLVKTHTHMVDCLRHEHNPPDFKKLLVRFNEDMSVINKLIDDLHKHLIQNKVLNDTQHEIDMRVLELSGKSSGYEAK